MCLPRDLCKDEVATVFKQHSQRRMGGVEERLLAFLLSEFNDRK
jgi:hypothetical protein